MVPTQYYPITMTLAGVGYHFLTPVTMVTTKSQASMAYVALHNPTVSYDTGDSVSCNHPFFSILKITCVTTRYPRIEPDTLQGYKSQGLALLIEQNLKGIVAPTAALQPAATSVA